MKSKILSLSLLGREAAPKAGQREDLGLPANLEKINSLFTPLFSAPFGNISIIFQNFWIISQSSFPEKIQLKLTLVPARAKLK